MSNTDISLENVLMNDSIGLYFGVDTVKEVATGTIGGSPANADFKVTGPIYPKIDVHIVPTIDDVAAYLRKAGGSPAVDVDTEATVSALKSSGAVDPDTGEDILDTLTLASAPTTETADHVVVSYAEQIQPCIAQDISPTLKQTIKEVERLYSAEKLYAYGSIDIKIKSEQIMSEDTINIISKLLYQDYTSEDSGTVTPGYEARVMRSKPVAMFGHIPVRYDNDILGIFKLRGIKISPDIPSVKAGDTGKFTIEATVPKMPILLTPTA